MKLSDGISFSFEPAKIRLVPKSHNIVHYFIISGIMILGSFANRNLFAENENIEDLQNRHLVCIYLGINFLFDKRTSGRCRSFVFDNDHF